MSAPPPSGDAAAADSEEEEEDDGSPFRRAGAEERKLIANLSAALRISRLHALDNAVAVEALTDLVKVLGPYLHKRERAQIVTGEDRISVNGGVVRLRRGAGGWLRDFSEFLARMGVGAITFRGEWTVETVRVFVEAFAQKLPIALPERVRAIAEFAAKIPEPARAEILSPEDAAKLQEDVHEVELTDSTRAVSFYARLVALAEAGHAAAAAGRSPDVQSRHLRAAISRITDALGAGLFEVRILALTALPLPQAEPLARHSANLAVLVLAMARRLGLKRGRIADLGFAALGHDLGRTGGEFRRAGPDGQSEDVASRDAHVTRGVAVALKSRGYGEAELLRILVAQEHHLGVDRFPSAGELDPPHAISRLVGIADHFDKLAHGTPWAPAIGPARALRALIADKARFDPEVVALLRDVLGDIPRGSLVKLRDRSVAVVVDGGARRGHRAVARRLLGPDGQPPNRSPLFVVERAAIEKDLTPADVTQDWAKLVVS